jgi:hypothetical protein
MTWKPLRRHLFTDHSAPFGLLRVSKLQPKNLAGRRPTPILYAPAQRKAIPPAKAIKPPIAMATNLTVSMTD